MTHKRALSVIILSYLILVSCGPLSVVEFRKALSSQFFTPTPLFEHCNLDQSVTLQQALQGARDLAHEAYESLRDVPQSNRAISSRFLTWFGRYNSDSYNLVMDNYHHIDEALTTQTITFSCTCSDLKQAFVYADQPYEITLCASFWTAPASGSNSQAGVLLHEISHFKVVAGTDDMTYLPVHSRLMAQYAPDKAIQNANNYRFYAENDPSFDGPINFQ
jgi:peptidyl-Lys metalloendopeptidase